MPTSGGGGGHGGGGGGFHGGGHSGGGHHGGSYFYFGPRVYHGGLFGMIFGPSIILIVLLIVSVILVATLAGSVGTKTIDYSSEAANDYAMEQYEAAFKNEAGGFEDKVLIAFFTHDDYVKYDYYSMIGDDLTNAAYNKFRDNDGSAMTIAFETSINQTSYRTTLGRDLSDFVDKMADSLSRISTPFRCEEAHIGGESRLVDYTNLNINSGMVNESLKTFTEKTGIELVLVVANGADVFGYQSILPLIFALLFVVFVFVILVISMLQNVKNWKKNKGNGNPPAGNSGTPTDGNPTDGYAPSGYTTGAELDGTAKKNDPSDSSPWGDNW